MGNQVTNIGGVLSAVTTTIAYTDSSAVTVGTIPANAQIIDINIDVTTAFDAGTTNTIEVGNSSNSDAYVTATDVDAAGRASVATTGVYADWADVGTAEVAVTAAYTQSGTAATAGAARVTVVYRSPAP
jgi:hypothetical protein